MTNFNFGMVLDWKSEPHDSLVASQPHTHTRLVWETHIADTIVSESCVKLILFKKVAYRVKILCQINFV